MSENQTLCFSSSEVGGKELNNWFGDSTNLGYSDSIRAVPCEACSCFRPQTTTCTRLWTVKLFIKSMIVLRTENEWTFWSGLYL